MITWLKKKLARPEVGQSQSLTDTPAPAVVSLTRLSSDTVAARAADIWHRKGRPHGQDEQNWLEAEAELRAESGSADPRKPR